MDFLHSKHPDKKIGESAGAGIKPTTFAYKADTQTIRPQLPSNTNFSGFFDLLTNSDSFLISLDLPDSSRDR